MATETVRTSYYPIYLSLAGETCLIVGGTAEAEAITAELLHGGAQVVVVAPSVSSRLAGWAALGVVDWHARQPQLADVQHAALVVVATGDPATDASFVNAAEQLGRLVTRPGSSAAGNCLIPPSFRQGDLTVAISTSGVMPSLDRRLVEQAAADFGPEWATFLSWLGEKRAEIKERYPSLACRIRLWDAVVGADVLDMLRAGREIEARRRYEAILRDWTPNGSTTPASGEPACS